MDSVMSSPDKIELRVETASLSEEPVEMMETKGEDENVTDSSQERLSSISSASPGGGALLTLSSPQCKIYDDILEEGEEAGGNNSLSESLTLDIYDDVVMGSSCLIGVTSQSSSTGSQQEGRKTEGCENDEDLPRRPHVIGSVTDEEYVPQPLGVTNSSQMTVSGGETNGSRSGDGGVGSVGGKIGGVVIRKHSVLVGNLTWWTTDEQIEQAMKSIGIKDVVDVKIFDSRLNGQSKGYCVVTFSSEGSVTAAFERGEQLCINDRIPCIKPDTKQNMIYFESKSTTRTNNCSNSNGMPTPSAGMMNYQPIGLSRPCGYGSILSPPARAMWAPGNGPRMPMRSPFPGKAYHPGRAGPPTSTRNSTPTFASGHNFGFHNGHANGYGSMVPVRPMPPHFRQGSGYYNQPYQGEWVPHRPHYNAHYQGQPPPTATPSTTESLGYTAAASRIPVFSNGNQFEYPLEDGQYDDYGDRNSPPFPNSPGFRKLQSPVGGSKHSSSPTKDEISDSSDVLEMHDRNSAVSTAAIQRAVHDAGNGEFASAIETLVTAINLLKNSKVAKDRRNLILINSLQDTLEGIEHRSYGSSKDRKTSSRDKIGNRKSYERSDRVSRSPRRSSRSEYGLSTSDDRDPHRSGHYREYYRLSSDTEKTQKRRSWEERHEYSPERDAERARKVHRTEYCRLKIKTERP